MQSKDIAENTPILLTVHLLETNVDMIAMMMNMVVLFAGMFTMVLS